MPDRGNKREDSIFHLDTFFNEVGPITRIAPTHIMLKAQTELTTRWADCDPMGHVNNANYFTYMEQGRVALLRSLWKQKADQSLKAEQIPIILAEISCQFLKAITFDQSIRIESQIAEVKNSSFIISYEITDKTTGEKLALGRSAQVWYDYQSGKSTPIPKEVKEKMLA